MRTFVSRDRNWIKNIGIKTHNKCNIICIRVRLLTAFGFEEEEEECSSQDDPLAVVHLDLSREAFWVCVSLSRLHARVGLLLLSLGKTTYLWRPISDTI